MNMFPCHYCGELFFFGQLTKDHIVPKGLGGRDIVENVVPSCLACNQRKGDSWPECQCEFCVLAVTYFRNQFEGMKVVRKGYQYIPNTPRDRDKEYEVNSSWVTDEQV
jgi:hypothetical protein